MWGAGIVRLRHLGFFWDDAADFPYVVVVVVVMWPCGIHGQRLDVDSRNAHVSTFQHTEALRNPQAPST